MATSEIEKLERRYAENPHGLTFAPLAEVNRKNGDVARALELLRVGLELHPNYIPASIVLGRCHQDLGDLPAAEEAFAHVLRLDDENVIALKSLADINERQNRLDDAERWLRRLVSVDRTNDEAREQLERVEAARERSSRATPAPAVGSKPEVRHEIAVVEKVPSESRSAPAESAPLELTDDVNREAAEVLEPAALQNPQPTAASELPSGSLVREPEPPSVAQESTSLAGLESAEFEPPKTSPPPPLGLEIETESDVVLSSSGASEFNLPDASQDFAALAAKMNASRPRTPGRRASDRAAVEPPKATAKPEPAQPVEPPQAPVSSPPRTPTQPAAPVKAYAARDTNGQSIAAFFQALLVARPPAQSSASASAGGDATGADHAAQPSSQGSNGEIASPAPSASPQGKDGLVSFDDFFGSASGGSTLAAGGEPVKDDLDQFHSWLQNLKR